MPVTSAAINESFCAVRHYIYRDMSEDDIISLFAQAAYTPFVSMDSCNAQLYIIQEWSHDHPYCTYSEATIIQAFRHLR